MTVQQTMGSLAWFAAVVAAIPVLLWLIKRSGYGGGTLVAHKLAGAPRTVASLLLSGQQRVVTVEVGEGDTRTWLVLGVTPQGISTLHVLPATTINTVAVAGAQPAPTSPRTFAHTLQQQLAQRFSHRGHAAR